MRRAVIAAGVLCGLLLGLVVLALNPLGMSSSGTVVAAGTRTLTFKTGQFRGFELTPFALLGISGIGADGAGLPEPAIRYSRIDVAALSADSSSAVALAVHLSSIARQNSLWRARFGVVTDWNIVWPEQGSLFLSGSENFWPVVADCIWSLLRGHGLRPRAPQYDLSPVPGAGTGQSVNGARGSFAGARGSFGESFEPLPGAGDDLGGRRTLHLSEAH